MLSFFLLFDDNTGEKWHYQNVEGKPKNARKDAEEKKKMCLICFLENGLFPCYVCSQPWAVATGPGLLKRVV